MDVVAAVPSLFTVDSSGVGQGAILNQDFSRNSESNPAERGSVVMIYGTGEGLTDPLPQDGAIIGGPSLPLIRQSVSVRIGGQETEVLYAGAAPGLVAGVFQINARVPARVSTGAAIPLEVLIGSVPSQPGVVIAIK